jgi:hypothetical protein
MWLLNAVSYLTEEGSKLQVFEKDVWQIFGIKKEV